MKITYNKLVRDNIPEITLQNGGKPVTRVLSDEAYIAALTAKLQEECTEFTASRNLTELADIQEVVYALAEVIASREELERVRATKATERGAFTKKIWLESVDQSA